MTDGVCGKVELHADSDAKHTSHSVFSCYGNCYTNSN